MIDGVCAEIQLSTYKAWAVKDAGEAIYQATRDFNMAIENKKIADAEKQLQLMIENYEANPTPELKEAIETQQAHVQTLKLELFKKIQRNKELNTLSVEMFNELHSDGDFYSVEAEVEALLYSFTYTMQVEHQIPDSRLGKSFARGPDGFVDIAHAEHIIDEVLPISHAVQDSLIQKIEKSLLKNSENVASGNSKWIKYANLIIEYQKRYNIRILQSLSPEVFNSNIDLITRHREIMIEILVDFVSNNNIDITKIDDIIIMFNNEITMNPEQYPKLPQSIETLIANINEITTAESMSKQ